MGAARPGWTASRDAGLIDVVIMLRPLFADAVRLDRDHVGLYTIGCKHELFQGSRLHAMMMLMMMIIVGVHAPKHDKVMSRQRLGSRRSVFATKRPYSRALQGLFGRLSIVATMIWRPCCCQPQQSDLETREGLLLLQVIGGGAGPCARRRSTIISVTLHE